MTYKKRFLNKSGISSPISGGNSNPGAWNGSPGQNGSETGGWNNDQFGIIYITVQQEESKLQHHSLMVRLLLTKELFMEVAYSSM